MAQQLLAPLQVDITRAKQELQWRAPFSAQEQLQVTPAPIQARRGLCVSSSGPWTWG
ncbi:hypothetical protein [Deinococcus multiflagellatus]|uniref:Uncharacterized protein n=1 Tax=Deinococcus multiflagellatus TaxID=1656887 RepID=A0ABW1ZL71_9DEIO